MIRYIVNGNPIDVKPEDIAKFEAINPSAERLATSQPTEIETKRKYIDSSVFKKADLPFISTGANIINYLIASIDIATNEDQQQQLGTYLKNRIDNIPESFQSALYSARQNYYDIYQRDFNIGHMDEEEQKRIRERAQKIILKDFENIKNLEFKDTGKGIVAGAREGDAASVIAGVFGAGVSMVETAVPAYFTGGLSLPIQVAAPMYTEYNKAKAKQLYGDDPDAIEKLIRNIIKRISTNLFVIIKVMGICHTINNSSISYHSMIKYKICHMLSHN